MRLDAHQVEGRRQMVARGTRLCPDLFGPGEDKQFFAVFDFCQNLEYFSQPTPNTEPSIPDSLLKRLFRARLDVVRSIDTRAHATEPETALRGDIAAVLHRAVEAMNVDNVVVRPHRRVVETFSKSEAWATLDTEAYDALSADIAPLPAAQEPEKLEARQFDLLTLNLQLCVLAAQAGFGKRRDDVIALAGLLSEGNTIPAIAAEMELILAVQSESWWTDVSVAELEQARRRLRGLMHLIERRKRSVLTFNFKDDIGAGQEIVFDRFVSEDAFAKFKEKAWHFLKAHEDHIAIHKLRTNLALTPTDLLELERILRESGTGTPREIEQAKTGGLGLFVRGLVGLDRAAAQQALGAFLDNKTHTADQIEFIQTVIENLTRTGVVDPGRLYEAPYTRLSAKGVEGLFPDAKVEQLLAVLEDVRLRAVA